MLNNRNHQQPHGQEAPPFFEPILEYYWHLPPITRTWFSLSLLVTTLNTFDLFSEHELIFIWDKVKWPSLELWRIVTSFTWAGPGTLADFPVLMLLYAMVTYVSGYEMDPHESGHRSRRQNRQQAQSDCLFAYLCCTIIILGGYLVITETTLLDPILRTFDLDDSILQPLFTRTLIYAILTLDSFRHPDRNMNVNFFPVQGRYVPLFHAGFAVCMGYRVTEIIHGIVVAAIYLFLIIEDSAWAAMLGRKRIIFKPQWLGYLIGEEMDQLSGDEVSLDEGGNILHRAAAQNDIAVFLRKLRQLESVSPDNIAVATAPFRQKAG